MRGGDSATRKINEAARELARPLRSDRLEVALVDLSVSAARSGQETPAAGRAAVLAEVIVDQVPASLLRGLIHNDGWRGVNRVVSKGKVYEYPRYQFSNRSDDIRRIFTDACDGLGIEWRRWTRFHISVAKKESVALLDSFVGPKS
jgi:hypothetical protein